MTRLGERWLAIPPIVILAIGTDRDKLAVQFVAAAQTKRDDRLSSKIVSIDEPFCTTYNFTISVVCSCNRGLHFNWSECHGFWHFSKLGHFSSLAKRWNSCSSGICSCNFFFFFEFDEWFFSAFHCWFFARLLCFLFGLIRARAKTVRARLHANKFVAFLIGSLGSWNLVDFSDSCCWLADRSAWQIDMESV